MSKSLWINYFIFSIFVVSITLAQNVLPKPINYDVVSHLSMIHKEDAINISFNSFGEQFEFLIYLKTDLFSPTAKVYIYRNEKELHDSFSPKIIAYQSKDNSVRLTLLPDKRFYASIKQNEILYIVEPAERRSGEAALKSFNEKEMICYRYKDFSLDSIQNHFHNDHNDNHNSIPLKRQLTDILMKKTCTFQPQQIDIGVAADAGYTKFFGGAEATQNTLIAYYNIVNGIYESQLGIHLTISSMVIKLQAGSPSWNNDPTIGCGLNINNTLHLETFQNWVASSSNPLCNGKECGLWHLHTDCNHDPTYANQDFGAAYIGVLCQGITGYNTAISVNTGATSWFTIAHLIAHNFNAKHTNDNEIGIMSLTKTTDNTFIDKNPICSHIKSVLNKCLRPYSFPQVIQPMISPSIDLIYDPCECSIENLCVEYKRGGCNTYKGKNYCYVKGYQNCTRAEKSASCTDKDGKSLYFLYFDGNCPLKTTVNPLLSSTASTSLTPSTSSNSLTPSATSASSLVVASDPCSCAEENLCMEYSRGGCMKYKNFQYCYVKGYNQCPIAKVSQSCTDKFGKRLYYIEFKDMCKTPFSSSISFNTTISNPTTPTTSTLMTTPKPNPTIKEIDENKEVDPCLCSRQNFCQEYDRGGCNRYNGTYYCYVIGNEKCLRAKPSASCSSNLNGKKLYYIEFKEGCPLNAFVSSRPKLLPIIKKPTRMLKSIENDEDPCGCSTNSKCDLLPFGGCQDDTSDGWCYVNDPIRCKDPGLFNSTNCPGEKYKSCESEQSVISTYSPKKSDVVKNIDPCSCSKTSKCSVIHPNPGCQSQEGGSPFCFVENPSLCADSRVYESKICPGEKIKLCHFNNNTNSSLYNWIAKDWDEKCSVDCGGGERRRTVYCTSRNGEKVNDSFCERNIKPSEYTICNSHSCSSKARKTYGACRCINDTRVNESQKGCFYHETYQQYGCYVEDIERCPLAFLSKDLTITNQLLGFLGFGSSCPLEEDQNKERDECECLEGSRCSYDRDDISIKKCVVSDKCSNSWLQDSFNKWMVCGDPGNFLRKDREGHSCAAPMNSICVMTPGNSKFCDCICDLGYIYDQDTRSCVLLPSLEGNLPQDILCGNSTSLSADDLFSRNARNFNSYNGKKPELSICVHMGEGYYSNKAEIASGSINSVNYAMVVGICAAISVVAIAAVFGIRYRKRSQQQIQTNYLVTESPPSFNI